VTRSLRILGDAERVHPDHHLWKNGRIWWVAFTFHTGEGRKHRVRRSLGTADPVEARARRDGLLAEYARRPGWRLALRFVERETDGAERDGLGVGAAS
jgi:hypothetical protein